MNDPNYFVEVDGVLYPYWRVDVLRIDSYGRRNEITAIWKKTDQKLPSPVYRKLIHEEMQALYKIPTEDK